MLSHCVVELVVPLYLGIASCLVSLFTRSTCILFIAELFFASHLISWRAHILMIGWMMFLTTLTAFIRRGSRNEFLYWMNFLFFSHLESSWSRVMVHLNLLHRICGQKIWFKKELNYSRFCLIHSNLFTIEQKKKITHCKNHEINNQQVHNT